MPMYRVGDTLKEQQSANNLFQNLKSPSPPPPPPDLLIPPTPMPSIPPPCVCKNCLVQKFQKNRIEENCDCHSCYPRKDCKCQYCQNEHDHNCMCNDCINLRISAHSKKYDQCYNQKYFQQFKLKKV